MTWHDLPISPASSVVCLPIPLPLPLLLLLLHHLLFPHPPLSEKTPSSAYVTKPGVSQSRHRLQDPSDPRACSDHLTARWQPRRGASLLPSSAT
ncbi:hypothetical protein F4777DRAFT_550370 [Nemania sp. FL0916]|nr:hypothetical protein F4777DRAFT_550370 [Nemania sp. FL0916]